MTYPNNHAKAGMTTKIPPRLVAREMPALKDRLDAARIPQIIDRSHQHSVIPAMLTIQHNVLTLGVLHLITTPLVPPIPTPSQFAMIGMMKMINGINLGKA